MKIRNKAIFSLAILVVAISYSCKTTDNADETIVQAMEEPAQEPVKDISKSAIYIEAGNLFGSGEEGISEGGHVFNNWDEAKAFTVKMNSFNQGFKGFGVDMNENTVVTYFDQVRPTLGHAVKFVSMKEHSNKIVVEYQLMSPTGDAAEVITQPYIMVYLPKTDKKFSFVLTE